MDFKQARCLKAGVLLSFGRYNNPCPQIFRVVSVTTRKISSFDKELNQCQDTAYDLHYSVVYSPFQDLGPFEMFLGTEGKGYEVKPDYEIADLRLATAEDLSIAARCARLDAEAYEQRVEELEAASYAARRHNKSNIPSNPQAD